jgi:cytidylate kinase
MKERDYQDSHRAASPLCAARDAVSLDTTEMSFDETVAEIRRLALDATGKC